MDAFVIRGTLVPAFMRLAGDANWWAPPWMQRIHDRIGISETVDLDDGALARPAPPPWPSRPAPARRRSTREDERVGAP